MLQVAANLMAVSAEERQKHAMEASGAELRAEREEVERAKKALEQEKAALKQGLEEQAALKQKLEEQAAELARETAEVAREKERLKSISGEHAQMEAAFKDKAVTLVARKMADVENRSSPKNRRDTQFFRADAATALESEVLAAGDRTFTELTLPEGFEYHIFLSHRSADVAIARKLYYMLRLRGLRVWWEHGDTEDAAGRVVRCIPDGKREDPQGREDEFAKGAKESLIFAPLMSKAAVEHCSRLKANSKCDPGLLEYRLALELYSQKCIDSIVAVLVGEWNKGTQHYHVWHPSQLKFPAVVVKEVEEAANAQLAKLSRRERAHTEPAFAARSPSVVETETWTVSHIMASLPAVAACKLLGPEDHGLQTVETRLLDACKKTIKDQLDNKRRAKRRAAEGEAAPRPPWEKAVLRGYY